MAHESSRSFACKTPVTDPPASSQIGRPTRGLEALLTWCTARGNVTATHRGRSRDRKPNPPAGSRGAKITPLRSVLPKTRTSYPLHPSSLLALSCSRHITQSSAERVNDHFTPLPTMCSAGCIRRVARAVAHTGLQEVHFVLNPSLAQSCTHLYGARAQTKHQPHRVLAHRRRPCPALPCRACCWSS